jgi:hypothetical protein
VKSFLAIEIVQSGTDGAANVDQERRDFLKQSTAALALAGLGVARATSSLAADYPTNPIRLIVGVDHTGHNFGVRHPLD